MTTTAMTASVAVLLDDLPSCAGAALDELAPAADVDAELEIWEDDVVEPCGADDDDDMMVWIDIVEPLRTLVDNTTDVTVIAPAAVDTDIVGVATCGYH